MWEAWRIDRGHDTPIRAVTSEELVAFFRYLETEHVAHGRNPKRPAAQTGLAAQSRDSCWRTFRALWNYLATEGWLQDDQRGFFAQGRVPRPLTAAADEDADGDAIDVMPADKAIDRETVRALIRACGLPATEIAARNRAIVWLLYESGCRVSELCSINDRSIDLTNRTAKVRAKGNRWRFIFWGPEAERALTRYLARRSGAQGGKIPLFRGVASRNNGLRLTGNAVRSMIKRLAETAGVILPNGAPVHGFRAGFAQWCLDAGLADLDVQQLLGHKDIRTTALYTKRHPRRLRTVHQKIFHRHIAAAQQGETGVGRQTQ
jgi:site-specific recombinase XerD